MGDHAGARLTARNSEHFAFLIIVWSVEFDRMHDTTMPQNASYLCKEYKLVIGKALVKHEKADNLVEKVIFKWQCFGASAVKSREINLAPSCRRHLWPGSDVRAFVSLKSLELRFWKPFRERNRDARTPRSQNQYPLPGTGRKGAEKLVQPILIR